MHNKVSPVIVSIVASIGVILALVGGYFYLRSNLDQSPQADSAESSFSDLFTDELGGAGDSSNSEQKPFKALTTSMLSFEATIKTVAEGFGDFTGTITHDGQGNVKFVGQQENDTLEIYLTRDHYIFCLEDGCYGLPNDGASPINDNLFIFDEVDFNEFKKQSEYLGVSDCASGTCNIWGAINEDDTEVEIYVDEKTGLISQVIGIDDSETTTIVYSYRTEQRATIEIPVFTEDIPGES